MVTQEQQVRAKKVDAQMRELLTLDILDHDRSDHINHARELLQAYAQTFGLAIEVLGDEIDPEAMNETVRWVVETHLRIAEALR